MRYIFSKEFQKIASAAIGSMLVLISCGENQSNNGAIPCNFKGKKCDDGRKETVSDVYNDSCRCVGKLYKKPIISQGAGVTDADGNSYTSLIVNEQEWMGQNLKVKKYRNGDPISTGLDEIQWNNTEKGAFVQLNGKREDGLDFGCYYNWFTTKDPRGLCPTGWHVPSGQEWLVLEESLGGEAVTGKKMKTTSGWINEHDPYIPTNESQFSALPGGYAYGGGMSAQGYEGLWWSNAEYDESYRGVGGENIRAYAYRLVNNDTTLGHIQKSKTYGLSVRCIKD
jgi:uncharacterized protein (TIGR02145 family)